MWRAGLAMVASACGAASVHTGAAVRTADLDQVPASPSPAEPVVATPPVQSDTGSADRPPPSLTQSPAPGTPEQAIVLGLLDGDMALAEAWDRWRAGTTTTYDGVFEIAVLANRARPLDTADELMVMSLARAVELSGCDPDRLGKIRLLAIAVRSADHPHELDEELTRLADTGPAECSKSRP